MYVHPGRWLQVLGKGLGKGSVGAVQKLHRRRLHPRGCGAFRLHKDGSKELYSRSSTGLAFFLSATPSFLLPYHLFPLPLPVERPIGAHPRQQRHLLHQDRRQPFQGRILRIKLFVACFVEPSWVEPSSVELLKKTENKAILCFAFFV